MVITPGLECMKKRRSATIITQVGFRSRNTQQ